MKSVGGRMKKEKIRNIKVSHKLPKLIGAMVLVDSLIIGTVALGGHIPINQDEKKVYQVYETVTKKVDNKDEITISNYYQNEVDTRSRVVYYKKPYIKDGKKIREVETIIKDNIGPIREYRYELVEDNDNDSYIETYQYDIDTSKFITVRETLHDELLSDTTLLLLLGVIDTTIYAVGKSFLDRKEEEEKNKELVKSQD